MLCEAKFELEALDQSGVIPFSETNRSEEKGQATLHFKLFQLSFISPI